MTTTYPKLVMILGATTLTFEKGDVVSAKVIEEIHPISNQIPIGKLEFQVVSYDDDFSMFSGSYLDLLADRPPITAYEVVDGEDVLLGKYYLDDWENISEYEYTFESMDIIGVLDKTPFEGAFFETLTSVEAILELVLGGLDLTYDLVPYIGAKTLKGWIPPGTYRSALQQVCFASGAVAVAARDEDLQIVREQTNALPVYDSEVADTEKTSANPVKLKPLVTSIELVSHLYTQSTELLDIYEEDLDEGLHKIIFDQPLYGIIVAGPGYMEASLTTEDDAFQIVTEDDAFEIEIGGAYIFGSNSVNLQVSAPGGVVTITGYPYIDSQRGWVFTESGIGSSTDLNAIKVPSATLVSPDNVEENLDLLRDYFQIRYEQEMTLFPTTIKPNDIIQTTTLKSNELNGIVEKMVLDLTRGYLAKIRMVGNEV